MTSVSPHGVRLFWLAASLAVVGVGTRTARGDDPRELFERSIRPYLVERCYGCHATHGTREADLALDWAGGMREGGASGAAVVPGRPDESVIMTALRHADGLLMPKGGPKPPAEIVAAFRRWIELGAVDPRAAAPSAVELERETSWDAVFARRRAWWSLQPIVRPEPPPRPTGPAAALAAGDHPVDRFVAAKLAAAGVEPAAEADPETLLRRATLVLTGLPPSPEERAAFLADAAPDRWERLVDRLLDSPHFAEHWARHWLDCVRYCETHGSEGDPAIPHAWRYRDWCIRAIRDDVPVDRFIREQVAGDLLADPRIDPATRVNESALGIGHLRMVPHGFSPTDALDEMVTFTDNQIDVLSKAFLGLTVSCARCHDHKFDAIPQADFYALYGVLASCRPAIVHADAPAARDAPRAELALLKGRIRAGLAAAWLDGLDDLPARLAAAVEREEGAFRAAEAEEAALKAEPPPAAGDTPERRQARARIDAAKARWADLRRPDHPLAVMLRLDGLAGEPRQRAWDNLRSEAAASGGAAAPGAIPAAVQRNVPPPEGWLRYGDGVGGVSPPGEFRVEPEGDRFVTTILPAGIHSNLLVSSDGGLVHSARFPVENDTIRVVVAGEGAARVKMPIWHYPRGGLNHPSRSLEGGRAVRVEFPAAYWRGEMVHLEIATAGDLAVESTDAKRSWFSLYATGTGGHDTPSGLAPAPLLALPRSGDAALPGPAPADRAALAAVGVPAVRAAAAAWRDGAATDPQVRLLDALVSVGTLPADAAGVPGVAPLVERYRELDRSVPPPVRAPGVVEATVVDQPLLVRGDHKAPAGPVPRRFLAAIDPRPFVARGSGRLELADRLVAADNPLTPRVFVNRVWHHVFGRGIVATVDNVGQMGDLPTHPELLDHLAAEFVAPAAGGGGSARPWSLKGLVRLLATSRTFRLASRPTDSARRLDPANTLFSHARLRRLEGESIRDAVLAVSGTLDRRPFGPGDPPGAPRRGIYLVVRRNAPDPFLSAFDPPSTQSTQGRRDESHVPAQALVLMNGGFVREQTRRRAERLVADWGGVPADERLRRLFVEALGREPGADEIARSRAFLDEACREHGTEPTATGAAAVPPWADVVHALVNTEEFIHVD